MATASSNAFQLIVPETARTVEIDARHGFTVPCHLSPELSAVDMEIRWFKETDCVCLYKNKQMIKGGNYEDRVKLLTHELERGNVSLSLSGFRRSDVGDYVCQVTSGDTTEEITVRVIKQGYRTLDRTTQERKILVHKLWGVCILHVEEINRTWTEEERLKMEDSALMTEKSKNPGDLKSFITEKDTKIKHLEEQRERLLTEKDKLIQEKDKILLENKQMLEVRNKELQILKNELQEMKIQLDEQNIKFTHQEKIIQEHKQQQCQYDEEIKNLHSEAERLKNESSSHLAELKEKCKSLKDAENLLNERDSQIKDLEKSKETALEEKDKLLNNLNNKLLETTREVEEKQREIEEKNKLMSEKEKLLENTDKELKSSKHELETLRDELQDKSSQLQLLLEENELLKSSVGKETSVSAAPVRRRNSKELDPPNMSGAAASVMVSRSELRLVLLGSSGSEKSSAGNIILNREKNQTDGSTESQQSERRQEEVDGKQVTVVETPDWFCSGLSLEEMRQDVRRCISLSAPGPHAFLLVIPAQQSTGGEREMLEKMEEILGEKCWRNTMILFTVSDEEQEKNSEEFIQLENQEVQRLVEKCGNRFHCLNIHQGADASQVSELLEKIEKMMEGNTERFFSSEIYLEIETQIRALERKITRDIDERKEREEREMKEKIEQEVQNYLRKTEGVIEKHETDIKQLNERTDELERQMSEERDEEKKKELKRELEKEVQNRTELERKITRLKEKREREKSEMEERHRQEMEEMRVDAERNIINFTLPKIQRNILDFKSKMQEDFIRQMEKKNKELETLTNNLSELRNNYTVMCEFHDSAMKILKST